jgi:hypothetical protein
MIAKPEWFKKGKEPRSRSISGEGFLSGPTVEIPCSFEIEYMDEEACKAYMTPCIYCGLIGNVHDFKCPYLKKSK